MVAYSLHIGLNAVDPFAYNGWNGPLEACENDARAMLDIAQSLAMQSVTLLTRNAISANLLNLMAELSWRAVPGDFIFITYAGHGSQIPDVNGDEPDGRDETWCLYDRMIVDDEIYAALSQFRAGVRIFFVSDSCHSGSVVRVMMQAGLDRAIPLIADFYGGNPIVSRAAPEPLARTIYERNANYFNAIQWNSGVEETRAMNASALVLSACQDNQVAADGAFHGLFTEKFLQIWANGAFRGSYRELQKRITGQMPPTQTPNLYTAGTAPSGFEFERVFSVGDRRRGNQQRPFGEGRGREPDNGGNRPESSMKLVSLSGHLEAGDAAKVYLEFDMNLFRDASEEKLEEMFRSNARYVAEQVVQWIASRREGEISHQGAEARIEGPVEGAASPEAIQPREIPSTKDEEQGAKDGLQEGRSEAPGAGPGEEPPSPSNPDYARPPQNE